MSVRASFVLGADRCEEFVLLTLVEYSQLCECGQLLLADGH